MKRKYVKTKYFFSNVPSKYCEWEKTKKAYVYRTEGVKPDDVEKTIGIIGNVIKDFKLPLTVLNGNLAKKEDSIIIQSLIASTAQQNLIDFDGAEAELERLRNSGLLPYGLIVLVAPKRYKFKNPHGCKEPAIYGCGTPEGLIVLRRFDIEIAVRHEFGHMIGLGHHHPCCVMDWGCSIHKFCEECRKEIKEIWEL